MTIIKTADFQHSQQLGHTVLYIVVKLQPFQIDIKVYPQVTKTFITLNVVQPWQRQYREHSLYIWLTTDINKYDRKYKTQDRKPIPVRNGISSARVRSTPRANAIVDSFLIEFSRSCEDSSYKISLPCIHLYQLERHKHMIKLRVLLH